MINIQFPDAGTVNLETLDEELRAALGDVCAGASTQNKNGRLLLTVHLIEDATDSHIRKARQLVNAHDPQRLSTAQETTQLLLQEFELAGKHKNDGLAEMNTYLKLQVELLKRGLSTDD